MFCVLNKKQCNERTENYFSLKREGFNISSGTLKTLLYDCLKSNIFGKRKQ